MTIDRSRSLFVSLLSLIVIAVAGCKSPSDSVKDASGGGALGTFGNGNLVVFSNELKTGGGAFLYPGGENQILAFNDTTNPVSARSIRYTWNGGPVASQTVFAGFDLMHTPTQATYASTQGRNLSNASYHKVTFDARGSLSDRVIVKVEVDDDGDPATAAPCIVLSENGQDTDPNSPSCLLGKLTANWLQYPVTGVSIIDFTSKLANVKDFFKATMICNQGGGNIPCQGGTVYFDTIQYTP
jgi:hypothetical protein